MPSLSKEKIKKIKESIIFCLYNSFPNALFTSEIANEIARDEEFTKKMLVELENEKIVFKLPLNKSGKKYSRRLRWSLIPLVYDKYSQLANDTSFKDYFKQ